MTRLAVFRIAICACLAFSCLPVSADPLADKVTDDGLNEFKQGNLDLAIKKFNEALNIDPHNMRALIYLEKSRKSLEKSPEELATEGCNEYQSGNLDAAATMIQEALKKDPGNVKAADCWKKIDAIKNASDDETLADVTRRIKRSWFPPRHCVPPYPPAPIVAFKIHKNGSVSDIKLIKSSGEDLRDKSCVEAVRNAAPFRPLPDRHNELSISFTFDYNLFRNSSQFR